MTRLIVRSLLTAAGWGVGSTVLAWAYAVADRFPSQGFDAGVHALFNMPMEWPWLAIGGVAGAVFALAAAAMRANGVRASASRRAMALLGAATMVPGVAAFTAAAGAPPFEVFSVMPRLGLLAVAIGAVLGWCTLAIGGARE